MTLAVQALQKEHDRKSFTCGQSDLDRWLQQVARQHLDTGYSRTFVLVDEAFPARILGFYSLSSCEIDTSNFPDKKRRPNEVPAVRLGRLAVSSHCQGKGYGADLLIDALTRIWEVAQSVGIHAVVVDAKDETAARFYAKYGFEPLTDAPLKLVMLMATIEKLFHPDPV